MADVAFTPVAPGPAGRAAAVVPSDATEFATPTKALYVGGTGNLAVVMAGQDSAVTIESIPVGTILYLSVLKVMSTNTTATKIVRFY